MHNGFELFSFRQRDFPEAIQLQFDDRVYQVKSNSSVLLQALSNYFDGYESDSLTADITIYLHQDEVRSTGLLWQDWPREAGKTRQKEQYCDTEDGRWIHKMKTGMILFQHLTAPLAVGPCKEHLSQTVNFIINQHINHLQHQGGLICHAACLQIAQQGIAIAAMSGGGKSTTMLKLLDLPDSKFISNDRLFIFNEEQRTLAKGVPKQPRVNPGTLLHNPKLVNILSPERQAQLQSMAPQTLWQLEEKYDVMVADVYGKIKLGHSAPLVHVVLLNWQPGGDAPVVINRISLDERPDLIKAIAKSPGSFYQDSAGQFLASARIPDDSRYQSALRPAHVWEISGGADFEQLSKQLIATLNLS